jgi:pyrroloquinoline quinone biosynthesis protein D
VTAIVDDLAAKFNAPRDLIARDVNALLQNFADKGVMTA